MPTKRRRQEAAAPSPHKLKRFLTGHPVSSEVGPVEVKEDGGLVTEPVASRMQRKG